MRRVIKDEMAEALHQDVGLVSPSVRLACGFNAQRRSDAGLPVGLQIAGRPFDEATALRVAFACEQATRSIDRRPPYNRP